jgi:hypothetical protein
MFNAIGDFASRRCSTINGKSAGFGAQKLLIKFCSAIAHRDPKPPSGAMEVRSLRLEPTDQVAVD